jgi:hypothetical protein
MGNSTSSPTIRELLSKPASESLLLNKPLMRLDPSDSILDSLKVALSNYLDS